MENDDNAIFVQAMDHACTQATVVQRVLKKLKSQVRETPGNSMARFMTSTSPSGNKQVRRAPTLPSAARRVVLPQPAEGPGEQGLMDLSIAQLANRRSEKQLTADSVDEQVLEVDDHGDDNHSHHDKPDNLEEEDEEEPPPPSSNEDADQCDFCSCFEQELEKLSRQVAQGSSFTSAELYVCVCRVCVSAIAVSYRDLSCERSVVCVFSSCHHRIFVVLVFAMPLGLHAQIHSHHHLVDQELCQ